MTDMFDVLVILARPAFRQPHIPSRLFRLETRAGTVCTVAHHRLVQPVCHPLREVKMVVGQARVAL